MILSCIFAVLCVGVASVCMGVVFQQIGGIFMQMSMTIGGAALGCCFGVFVLSFAFPWANGKVIWTGMCMCTHCTSIISLIYFNFIS